MSHLGLKVVEKIFLGTSRRWRWWKYGRQCRSSSVYIGCCCDIHRMGFAGTCVTMQIIPYKSQYTTHIDLIGNFHKQLISILPISVYKSNREKKSQRLRRK